MAENIYNKGTRVWFEDKDQAWISAEVSSLTKTDDNVKIVFTDERGKVIPVPSFSRSTHHLLNTGNYGEYDCQGYQGRRRWPPPTTKPALVGDG